jgi:hypothetical protein
MSHDLLGRNLHTRTLPGVFALSLIVTLAGACAASPAPQRGADGAFAAADPGAQGLPPTADATMPRSPLTRKQRQDILKSKFEKMKEDAEELAALANSLQDEVDKSSQNILSLEIVDKAEKIEKLAKRIKKTAKGD